MESLSHPYVLTLHKSLADLCKVRLNRCVAPGCQTGTNSRPLHSLNGIQSQAHPQPGQSLARLNPSLADPQAGWTPAWPIPSQAHTQPGQSRARLNPSQGHPQEGLSPAKPIPSQAYPHRGWTTARPIPSLAEPKPGLSPARLNPSPARSILFDFFVAQPQVCLDSIGICAEIDLALHAFRNL